MLHRIGIFVLLLMASRFPLAQAVNITHGPMLGHVTAESISIWARTSKPGQFQVQYGRMPDRLDQVSEATTTTADRDNTGWVRLNGLSPNTRYYYRPVTSSDAGPAGSFLTLPASESYRDASTNPRGLFNFRFQFGSCADQRPAGGTGPGLPAYGTMLKQLPGSIHFSIMNGDWLYEDKREFTVDQWREQTGSRNASLPKILEWAPSIAGVWENYKYFLERGANLAAWHRVVPSYYTPDDHEILNDVFGTATVGRRDRRTVFRDIGIQAWFDYLAGSQPLPFSQPVIFGQASLTAGSDVLLDPNADFTK
ncbi:MAG TPA: alkaline phosphatase D family protein, partial [Terriglobia bacterium]|nr:alkaline phosphatase D family protein [Terriglobia bacterium]